jgi:hypothetical protein
MSERTGLALVTRRIGVLCAVAACASIALTAPAGAQDKHQAIVQIEVGDSIGLPLPDAKIEVFAFADGGVFWEWLPLGSEPLPAGINLLRFAYPGYETATFSVPVQEGGKVSLRVRLQPEHDTVRAKQAMIARPVNAIGLAIEGRAKTDIIGRRRILDRQMIDSESVARFGPLLRRARNTDLTVVPSSGGTFRVFSQSGGGGFRCAMQVMVNGDRRRILPFESFDQLFGTQDVEVIEIFPSGSSIPLSYQAPRGNCGLMVVWFKSL